MSAESTLTISSGRRCTSSTAIPVLPEAVGPIRKMASGLSIAFEIRPGPMTTPENRAGLMPPV
jgi:hypothetical protein